MNRVRIGRNSQILSLKKVESGLPPFLIPELSSFTHFFQYGKTEI